MVKANHGKIKNKKKIRWVNNCWRMNYNAQADDWTI